MSYIKEVEFFNINTVRIITTDSDICICDFKLHNNELIINYYFRDLNDINDFKIIYYEVLRNNKFPIKFKRSNGILQ